MVGEGGSEHRDQIFTELFEAILRHSITHSLRARKTGEYSIEVSDPHNPKAGCTVELLDHQPVFIASFTGSHSSDITFNISPLDAAITTPGATHCFENAEEAARRILEDARLIV